RRRRLPGAGRARGQLRGHARRGFRGREHGGRCVPARQRVLAHPARRGRPGAGRGCAWRSAHHPVLAGRGEWRGARAVGRGGARGLELWAEVGALREETAGRSDAEGAAATAAWLAGEASMEPRGADQAVAYVLAARAALGALPTQETVIAERFFDEAGGMQL